MIRGQDVYDVVSYVLKNYRELFDSLRVQVAFYYMASQVASDLEASELDERFESFIKASLATELMPHFKQNLTREDLKAIMYSSKWKEAGLDHLFMDKEDYLNEDLSASS